MSRIDERDRAYHVTQSNVGMFFEIVDQRVIVGAEESSTLDAIRQVIDNGTRNGCAIECRCSSS